MKDFTFKEIDTDESFDPIIFCEDTPFTQTHFYGDWQKNLGMSVRRFLVYKDNEIVAYFQLIKCTLLFGKSYLYVPYDPVTKNYSDSFLATLKEGLKRIAKTEKAVFVRLDFTPPINSAKYYKKLKKYFTKAPIYTYHSACFQPRSEWFLDLRKTKDQILKEMQKNARYSIHLAEKKNVKTEIVTKDFEKYFDTFYELMLITAKRRAFNLRSRSYYENIFQNLKSYNSYLSIAKYDGKIVSIYVLIQYGKIANHIFGCSSNERREFAPTYLAHWSAICYAKSMGAIYYNFGGGDVRKQSGVDNLIHFKKKFGGFEVSYSDFFDVVIEPFWYHLYNLRKLLKTIYEKIS